MTLISYRGRAAAMAGRERFYLAPHIAQRPDGDPVKTFVCFLAVYARDVLTGQLPTSPAATSPPAQNATPANAYSRRARSLRAATDQTPSWPSTSAFRSSRSPPDLAEYFNVPLEQIAARRAQRRRPRRRAPARGG